MNHLPLSKPSLTIITVCYNEVQRIARTADSVASQTSRSFEWIVVDGASSDGTLSLLDAYRRHVTRLVSEPDGGVYDAMNKAIRMAQGDYLLFLNGGDWLADSGVVEDFVAMERWADIVVGDILVHYADGHEQYRASRDAAADRDYLYWRSLPHQATFIRRDLFTRHGSYNVHLTVAADWDFFVRVILCHGASIERWARLVSVFTHDGISAIPHYRRQFCADRSRIRRNYYPLSYRVRRWLNESWGKFVHYFRCRFRRHCHCHAD